MKYSQRDNLVASLREAADFIEAHGIDLPFDISSVSMGAHIATYDRKTYEKRDPKEMKRDLKQAVRILKPVKKEYYGSTLYIKKQFGVISLSLTASRDVACKQVKTGKIILKEAVMIPASMEEEIEWVCTDPILRASK